jgi:8-oxo-dGTP diphosphatase
MPAKYRVHRLAGTVLWVPSPESQDPALPVEATGPFLRPVQRTAAYAVVTDRAGAVLLVRASDRSDLRGRWFLPGGGLRHGEDPQDAVLRELAEETGLRAARAVPRSATADVIDLSHRGVSVHTLRLIYDVLFDDLELNDEDLEGPAGLVLRPEADGTSDLARFVGPDELADLPVMPFVAELLDLPAPAPLQPCAPDRPEPLGFEQPAGGWAADPLPSSGNGTVEIVDHPVDAGEVPLLVQRPAAYAVLVDEAGEPRTGARILLTRLSGSRTLTRRGTWTLPGGGIDHGEHPLLALEREVYEETGLPYTVGPLLDISSRHFIGRSPNGRLEDFHALRLVYTGSVPADLPPQVIEVDGSTDKVAWIPVADLGRINTVPTVRDAFATWNESRGPAPGPPGER